MNDKMPPMRTTVGHDETFSTVTDHMVVVTFRYRGWLYTCIGDIGGNDIFIDHLTGKHIEQDLSPGSKFMELTEYFGERELWDV